MTSDPGGGQPGYQAPWASRKNMVIMAIAGPILSLLLLVIGVVELSTGHRGAALTIVGGVLVAVWLVAIPVARHRGKV